MNITRNLQRGTAEFRWLNARYSFSFANYYNPNRMHFGALRVLNDDIVQPGEGFGTHPHENMEIITIPLEGALAHKDSTGGDGVIKSGQIQVMSAGTGVQHSEFNASSDQIVNLLQIWVFPNKKGVKPRYETRDYELQKNQFTQLVSPNQDDDGGWIYQNAWISMGHFEEGQNINYKKNNQDNGLFAFIISGSVSIDDNELSERDSVEFQPHQECKAQAIKPTKILIIEIPMQI